MSTMGQPAFPKPNHIERGMEIGEYAAIHLKVPNSGTPWLDEMIRESRRYDFAAKAEGISPADDFSKLDALIEKSIAELKPNSDGMLANQRDELLAALKNLCYALDNEAWRYPTVLEPIVAEAYVVIAKAEGGAP